MKNLITQIACTMLLMAFLMAFSSVQLSNIKVLNIMHMINQLDSDITSEDRKIISDMAQCEESEVLVYIEHGIEFIELPVYDIIRPQKFWGIDEENNKVILKLERGKRNNE